MAADSNLTAEGLALLQLIVSGRWKHLQTPGVYERSFLDPGHRNNGLGPFCLELWREQSRGVKDGNIVDVSVGLASSRYGVKGTG